MVVEWDVFNGHSVTAHNGELTALVAVKNLSHHSDRLMLKH